MANTYTQAYFHLVFSPERREALIQKHWKHHLEKYISGIVQNHEHKLLAIGAMPDHIHIFLGYNLNQTIPELVEHIKTSSSHWIKHNGFTRSKFNWQKGYGAFTYAKSEVENVINYVRNQENHHKHITFKEEYLDLLIEFDVDYKDQYLFQFHDPDE